MLQALFLLRVHTSSLLILPMNARPNPTTFIAFAVVTIALATTSFAQSKSYSKGTVNVTPANVARTAPGTPPTISQISGTAVVNITAPNVIVTTMTGGTLNVGAAGGTASTVPVTIGTANGGSIRVRMMRNKISNIHIIQAFCIYREINYNHLRIVALAIVPNA